MFSPDSKRFGYIATRLGRSFTVIDGDYGVPFNVQVGERKLVLFFSPDGTRVGYSAAAKGDRFVDIDGKRTPGFDWVGDISFAAGGFPARKGRELRWAAIPPLQ